MNRKKLFLIIQAGLCVALALWLCAAVLLLLREGLARQAEDPLSPVFTPEGAAAALSPLRPLFFAALGWAGAGLLLGIRQEASRRPLPVPGSRALVSAARGALSGRARSLVQGLLLLAALLLILLGIFNGSALDVLYKAVNICSECIGLG